jgi:hypothetical protein
MNQPEPHVLNRREFIKKSVQGLTGIIIATKIPTLTGCGGGGADGQNQTGTTPGPTEGDDPGPYLGDGKIGDPAFTLTWSHTETDEGPDIDMWVIDPNLLLLSTSRDGYSLGPTPEGGVIDHDDQGATGPGDGGGPERAYWPQGKAPGGVYTYGVRYYTGRGAANYTFRIYKDGNLAATKKGTLSTTGERQVLGSACNVMAFQDLCDLYNANMKKFEYCQDLAFAGITAKVPPNSDTSKSQIYDLFKQYGYVQMDEGVLIPEYYDPLHDSNLQEGDIIMFYNNQPPNDPRDAPHYAVVRGGKVWSILHWDEGGQLDGPRDLAFFGTNRGLYNPYKGEYKTFTNPYVYFVRYQKTI